MRYCQIGDHELELLLQPFLAHKTSRVPTVTRNNHYSRFLWDLSENNITWVSVQRLKHLLTSQLFPSTDLLLRKSFNTITTNKYRVLVYLIECLFQENCALNYLDMSRTGFTEQHMYHLVLLLVHSHSLGRLFLFGNHLSTGFGLFCSALKMNKHLATLGLNNVLLSDEDTLLLADAIREHSKISQLLLEGCNSFQNNLFVEFLQKVFDFPSRSCLSIVGVDDLQYHCMKHQLEIYQAICQQKGLPIIDLSIVNYKTEMSPKLRMEVRARKSLNKTLLTGE